MSFAYTVTIDDPAGVADDTVLAANLTAALNAWSVYLSGKGSVDITMNIAAATSSNELGEGGSEVAVAIGTDGARTVYQTGTANEMVTGTDANGATDDGGITLNSTELSQIFFSANPAADTAQVGKYDGLSILEHELGHIFGIDGFRNSNGTLPSGSESTWDQLVSVTGRTASFTGKYADAVYGGPVPVTTTYDSGEAYFHFANSLRDQASNDLMSGTGLPTDTIRTIGPLDVATMEDIGTPLSSTGSLDVGASILLRLRSFGDFSSTANATIANLAAQVDGGTLSLSAAGAALIPLAASTTAVATLSYEFFTQKVPTLAGLDYLISPEGTNANNLNSAYYAQFSTENRFINFAVNLGDHGAGATAWAAAAGSLTLSQVMTDAYTEIFGAAPSAAQVAAFVGDLVPNGLGGTETRAQYFAFYGVDDLGTKAAAVGWLLAQAESADVGTYAKADDALLVSLIGANTSALGTDILTAHAFVG